MKQAQLKHIPKAVMCDGLGASEALSIAFSVNTKDNVAKPASFVPVNVIVIAPNTHEPVLPGSKKVGVIAKAGPLPLGYYKDSKRTALTYIEING